MMRSNVRGSCDAVFERRDCMDGSGAALRAGWASQPHQQKEGRVLAEHEGRIERAPRTIGTAALRSVLRVASRALAGRSGAGPGRRMVLQWPPIGPCQPGEPRYILIKPQYSPRFLHIRLDRDSAADSRRQVGPASGANTAGPAGAAIRPAGTKSSPSFLGIPPRLRRAAARLAPAVLLLALWVGGGAATVPSALADTVGPRAVSAATSQNGSRVTVTFDESIRSSPAPDSGLRVEVDGEYAGLKRGAYVVSGRTVTARLSTAVTIGQSVTVTVVRNGGLHDLAGNPARSNSGSPVSAVNTVPAVTLVLTPDSILENGGTSVVTARLATASSEETTVTVTVAPQHPAVATDITSPSGAAARDAAATKNGDSGVLSSYLNAFTRYLHAYRVNLRLCSCSLVRAPRGGGIDRFPPEGQAGRGTGAPGWRCRRSGDSRGCRASELRGYGR